ncbi:thioredoxin-disulfide reductase [Aquirufa sp.]|jgi:thioredoxin reductase (NADPH)|uniref:thioredoxin-disulfide reductase n=1 Tax=Aquirufa sp. TaxID=2676249 RepID=UPI003784818E
MSEKIKCLIIGSGPAGYTAAIYASRAGLHPVMYQGSQPGGQLTTTTEVDNFPGYPQGTDGPAMMVDLENQAKRFGTDVRFGMATRVDFTSSPKKVWIDDTTEIEADAVIIATGASAKWLGLEGETTFNGLGVSACAVCDGFFYRNQTVAVVGAGDTAAEEASYLANLCTKVHLIVRRNEMRASLIMQERVKNNPKIEIHWNSETEEILGDANGVTGIRIVNNITKAKEEIALTGFFVAIGHQPNTSIFKGQLEMDKQEYLVTEKGSSRTNIEGVFACGDVQDSIYRQAITAAGTGCIAALDAERWLAANNLH